MNILTIVLKCVNPYAAAYKQMHRVELENPSKMVTMFMKQGKEQRRYNEPQFTRCRSGLSNYYRNGLSILA